MASTFTPLGIEKQATGENAGTWGTKTNTNLEIVEQISAGFTTQAVSDSGDTTLSVSDGSTGATLAHRVIEFTGSLTASRNVTIPIDVQQMYVLKNSTSGSQNVVFKYASGTGDSITLASGAVKVVYATANDGTNPDIDDTGLISASSTDTLTNKTLTSPKIGTSILDTNGNQLALLTATSSAVNEFTIANAATGNGPTLSSTGDDTNIDINVTPKGTGDVVLAGDTVKVGDSGAAATLTSNGAGALTVTTGGAADLVLSTNSGTDSSIITITDAANGNIALTPNGTGEVVVGSGTANATVTSSGAHDLILDTNSGTNSGTITITDGSNGNINIAPNGTGVAQVGGTAIKVAGKETIWVPATAMYPGSTSGCADLAQTELSSDINRPVLKNLAFDKDSDESAQFAVAFPKSWNEGTITFQPYFTANSTNTGTALFMLKGLAISDNDAIDQDFGTAQGTAKAHSGTANDLDVGAESSAITIAGTPAAGDQVFFQIFRDVSGDSLTADALLLGIKIFFTTDAANDA